MSNDSIRNSIIEKINIDENLKELIEGKRVCICGPSVSQVGTNLGKEIDSYDIVCRVNMHLPWENQNDYGKRTDIMFSGAWPIFDGNLRKELLIYDKEHSKYYELLKELKMMYFIDPIDNESYRNNPYGDSDQCHHKSWDEFKEKTKETQLKYGVTNIWLTDICKKYIKSRSDIPKSFTKSLTNSGMHSILTILKHNPSELFITGFNFYNWGKGGKLEEVYQEGSTDYYNKSYLPGNKRRGKRIIGHVYSPTLDFSKKMFYEYKDCIKLDKVLKDFFSSE
jgi:hypothetical protein